MADKRTVSRGLLRSSTVVSLGAQNPGKGPQALAVFLALFFGADDHGRGRYLPAVIRSDAFFYDAQSMLDVSVEQVAIWINQIAQEGTIVLYPSGAPQYYCFPKWYQYQKLRRFCRSHIPEPPQGYDTAEPKCDVPDNLKHHTTRTKELVDRYDKKKRANDVAPDSLSAKYERV